MRILVTGAAGFVGRNVLLGLKGEHDVVATSRAGGVFTAWCEQRGLKDVRRFALDDAEAVAAAFKRDESFDAVVHLASNGDPAASVANPGMDLRCGLLGLVTLFERIRAGRLIYFSSGAVYDGCDGVVSPATPVCPTLPYAMGKFAAEHYVRSLALRLGRIRDYFNVRFFGAFGPHEPPRKIFTKLVRAFGIEGRQAFTVRGDGENLIDAMFIDDSVKAVSRMVHAESASKTIDLCSGRPLTINELVRHAAACFGLHHVRIDHDGAVPEYNRFQADPDGAWAAIGFRASTRLDAGLRSLLAHIQKAEA